MRMSRLIVAAASVLVFSAQSQKPAADISVTVTYKGAGTVDTTHEIWVFLFDNETIGGGSRPIDTIALTKSGDTATFKGVTVNPVYIGVAFDEGGAYDGIGGPPPLGSPIAIYRLKDAKGASPVKPGDSVKITFDDSSRMK